MVEAKKPRCGCANLLKVVLSRKRASAYTKEPFAKWRSSGDIAFDLRMAKFI